MFICISFDLQSAFEQVIDRGNYLFIPAKVSFRYGVNSISKSDCVGIMSGAKKKANIKCTVYLAVRYHLAFTACKPTMGNM